MSKKKKREVARCILDTRNRAKSEERWQATGDETGEVADLRRDLAEGAEAARLDMRPELCVIRVPARQVRLRPPAPWRAELRVWLDGALWRFWVVTSTPKCREWQL